MTTGTQSSTDKMKTEDEINKLKLANSIINRGTRKLGVRPLNLGYFENPYRTKAKQSTTHNLVPRPNINELAAKLKREQELNEELKKPAKFQTAFYSMLAVVLVFSMIFVFNPVDIIAGFDKNAKPKPTPLSTIESSSGRDLVICSGVFKSEKEANNYKKTLSERLGVPLKVLKDGSSYTLQVGPSYKNHEDALIVFDELSRYSVGNLSLRFAT